MKKGDRNQTDALVMKMLMTPVVQLSVKYLAQFIFFIFLCSFSFSCLASPFVFWASDPVDPDETVVLTGYDLSSVKTVKIIQLADSAFKVAANTTSFYNAKILQSSSHALKFLLPKRLRKGIYQYELIDSQNNTKKGFLNTASIYWIQGDIGHNVTVGGTLRIFGRNIYRKSNALIELVAINGEKLQLKATNGDLWEASFSLPKSTVTGKYSVRLWNGNGDLRTWVDAGEVEVYPMTSSLSYKVNVHDVGALGDGFHDDTMAIQLALQQVQRAGGGTVYFPRGYYKVSSGLKIPPYVNIKGEGRDLSNIVWIDFEKPPSVLLEGTSNFAVEDISLTAKQHLHILHGGFPQVAGGKDGENIIIRRVRIRASNYNGHLSPSEAAVRTQIQLTFAKNGVDSLGLAGKNLVVEDCDIYGSGKSLYLLRPIGARVSGNSFFNGRYGWYSISGANGLLFENNRIVGADMQSTGGGINTLFAGTGYSQNILFRKNRIESTYGWDGEALTTDGPGGFYYGSVRYSTNNKLAEIQLQGDVKSRPDLKDWRGAGVFIMGGRGMGQYARVLNREGDIVKLDRLFLVPPDTFSIVTIVPMQLHYLILDNIYTDAAFAVQLFGTAIDHVVANNISERTGGIANKALYYQHVQPNWYNQFLDNEIRTSSTAAPASIMILGQQKLKTRDVLNYASVLRKNRLLGNASIILRGDNDNYPSVSDTLVEKNKIERANFDIKVDSGVNSYILRDNYSKDVGTQMH